MPLSKNLAFRTFVGIRYNVGLFEDNWEKRFKRERPCDPQTWMEHRNGVFDRFCFPGLVMQCGEITVGIFMDEATPPHWMPNTAGCFVQKVTCATIKKERQEMIQRMPTKGFSYILTIRLDNDDMLMPGIVTDLEARAAKLLAVGTKPPFAIYMKNGFKFNMNKNTMKPVSMRHGPFVAVVDKAGKNPQTVWCTAHMKIPNKMSVFSLKTRGFVQIVHNYNLRNK